MEQSSGMENTFKNKEIESKIEDLAGTLCQLCYRHLNGCNSVYMITFYRIDPPESSSLAQCVTLQEGTRHFISKVLGGPWQDWSTVSGSDPDVVNIIDSIGAIPPTEEDLMQVFLTPMLEVLEPLQASFYFLTYDAEVFYEELLKPVIESLCTVAVCIDEQWFIMMGEWSD